MRDRLSIVDRLARRARQEKAPELDAAVRTEIADRVLSRIGEETAGTEQPETALLALFALASSAAAVVVAVLTVSQYGIIFDPLGGLFQVLNGVVP